ncbi:MAG: Ada metal-binding domain-containing protein [Desulfobacterales bacterium]
MKNEYFIGVKTTKIYCLPSCTSRAPLPQNMLAFETAAQAERSGFRPCKRCFPDFPYGEKFCFDKMHYYLFPTPQVISRLRVAELKRLQFTGKKSEYIIALAKKITDDDLSKKNLLAEDGFRTARGKLMQLHGIGQWTADYVGLRCLRDPEAFPISDVGLQNAVRMQLGSPRKPTADDISKLSAKWQNWQAYATFYLWASLI